jgi:hypothetical protein
MGSSPVFHSAAAVHALVDGVRPHADVIVTPLPTSVARLDLDDERPVLWLDENTLTQARRGEADASTNLSWALLDVLRVLARGPAAALHARRTRRLYSVS